MKKWLVYLLVVLMGLILVGTAVVYAQQDETPPKPLEAGEPPQFDPPLLDERHPQQPHPRPPRALRGEVTAVHETGLSLLTRNKKSVEVNVHSGTKIWLVETQSQGSLADIHVGDNVRVEGCRCGETSIGASRIQVGPEGDEIHGRVTAVESATIQLGSPEGTATVHTDGDTKFRLGREASGLEDVTEGTLLAAFGQTQSDGSLNAALVIVQSNPPKTPVRNVCGEVTAVSASGLTMSVRRRSDADVTPVSVQVNVTGELEVWLVESGSQGSLADIEVGDQVVVRGTRADKSTADAPAMDARYIAVGPDGDEVHGRVLSVDGTTLILQNREGQVTLRTNVDTSFRHGRAATALEDVTEGTVLVAFGELQADGSLDADQIYIRRGPPPPPDADADIGSGRLGESEEPRGGTDGPPPSGAGSAPMSDRRRSARQS